MSLVTTASVEPLLQPCLTNSGGRLSALLAGIARRSVIILLFCAAWEIMPRVGVVNRVFLPPFSLIVSGWWHLLLTGLLQRDVVASLYRAVGGLALAIITAVPLGLVIGRNHRIAEFFNPLLEIFRNTAVLALLPVFTLTLGIGETSKIAMVMYASAWPILLSTISAIQNVDLLLIKAARSMGLDSLSLFIKVILPASVPTIFTGIRLAAGHSILVLIAAEMVGSKAGLGYLVNAAEFNFQIPEMYAGILTLAILGMLVNLVLVRTERHLSSWRLQ
jgi:NitT/TauT family transport system permease protein